METVRNIDDMLGLEVSLLDLRQTGASVVVPLLQIWFAAAEHHRQLLDNLQTFESLGKNVNVCFLRQSHREVGSAEQTHAELLALTLHHRPWVCRFCLFTVHHSHSTKTDGTVMYGQCGRRYQKPGWHPKRWHTSGTPDHKSRQSDFRFGCVLLCSLFDSMLQHDAADHSGFFSSNGGAMWRSMFAPVRT